MVELKKLYGQFKKCMVEFWKAVVELLASFHFLLANSLASEFSFSR